MHDFEIEVSGSYPLAVVAVVPMRAAPSAALRNSAPQVRVSRTIDNQGEEVLIARDGKPVARLCRVGSVNRTQGAWASDPAWAAFESDVSAFTLLTEEEMRAEGWV